ncbi:hypothetical protein [Clostridium tyrobutyricum]|uniref:hypothetical protein n=1 Tax=Clostridium tyrobutyricum TaxID=1519 RepID=UPI001C39417F|nr:hypothetical protein [Clostridium tyrobutyricum]MBV4417184.1 hypothetical protein [Clostridium tyrobutyricum]
MDINKKNIENITKKLTRIVHLLYSYLMKRMLPIIKFYIKHEKEIMELLKRKDRKNKYLKRIKNRQILYNKRMALGRI